MWGFVGGRREVGKGARKWVREEVREGVNERRNNLLLGVGQWLSLGGGLGGLGGNGRCSLLFGVVLPHAQVGHLGLGLGEGGERGVE